MASLHRSMSLSESEFLRLLPLALQPYAFKIEGPAILVNFSSGGQAVIKLSPRSHHQVASLTLPVLAVDMEFMRLSAQVISEFVTRFDQTFQRGGG